MIARAASLLWRITYARYLMASVVALGADLTLFMALLGLNIAPIPASAAGYSFGLLVHWLASSRLVFARQATPFSSRKRKQKLLFVVSAMVGLAITGLIIGVGGMIGIDPRLSKLVAIALSFQTTYLLRRTVVFA